MKLANAGGRAVLLVSGDLGVDVQAASRGRYGPGLPEIYRHWSEFTQWATSADLGGPAVPIKLESLGPPSPTPGQVFGIGFNYLDHVQEAAGEPEEFPPVFTKFPSCISAPHSEVVLPSGGRVDWEVELVVVMAHRTKAVPESQAWSRVAGVCVGQDLSDRHRQFLGTMPQFNLGKSATGFGPTGPWLVTVDELDHPDDIELGCSLNGSVVQSARTNQLIWSVPRVISYLSDLVTLLPGDLIFTGTPAGTGMGRRPERYLEAGDRLRSWVRGVGEIEQTFVSEH